MATDINLTPEFEEIINELENTNKNVFISGLAGTGKSTLLKYFCENTDKNHVILAPTGVAALNVQGMTLHSFFQLPFGFIHQEEVDILHKKKKIFESLDTIIIDEISMVRADVMEAIDTSLRLNTGNKTEPFGGVQVIAFGDLFQLPPVARGEELEYLKEAYGGVYFFNAPAYGQGNFRKYNLTKIFRQKDRHFIDLLAKIRTNTLQDPDLKELNTRVTDLDEHEEPVITLASTNKIVDSINEKELAKLPGMEFTFKASVNGSFNPKDYPTQKVLSLKKGAQIMMIKNDTDHKKRWVNGSLGIITEITANKIRVKLDSGSYDIEKASWEVFNYGVNVTTGTIEREVKGEFKQYPIKLAWAVTIHKSQGKTFDSVIVDLGFGAFAHGQTYVALSRCTSLEGLYLKKPIRQRDIILDKEVVNYNAE